MIQRLWHVGPKIGIGQKHESDRRQHPPGRAAGGLKDTRDQPDPQPELDVDGPRGPRLHVLDMRDQIDQRSSRQSHQQPVNPLHTVTSRRRRQDGIEQERKHQHEEQEKRPELCRADRILRPVQRQARQQKQNRVHDGPHASGQLPDRLLFRQQELFGTTAHLIAPRAL